MALTVGLLVAGAAGACHFIDRDDLPEITHTLHPYHPLKFENADSEYFCDACNKYSPSGPRYTCRACDFDLRLACVTSKETILLWVAQSTDFKTFSHAHPVRLVKANSEFKCSYCNNKGFEQYRFQCQDGECLTQIHVICGASPTMVFSFLHPEQLLSMKTRHRFRKSMICHHGRKSNARVYTCEECDLFVHPECAQRDQYIDFPLHSREEHTLDFRQLTEKQKAVCQICGHKCKYWSCVCNVCQGIHYRYECLAKYYFAQPEKESSGFMEQVGEQIV